MLSHEIHIIKASLVHRVVDGGAGLKAALVVPQGRLVDRFGLVITKAVEGAHLVGMLVLLRGPGSAVPVLPVARVPGGQLVTGHFLQLHHLRVVELNRLVTGAPVRAAQLSGVEETVARGGGVVVDRLMVVCSAEHGTLAVASRCRVESLIGLGHQGLVESRGAEGVGRDVQSLRVKDFAGLLRDSFAKVVVVDIQTGHVSLIARNNSRLASRSSLQESYDLPLWAQSQAAQLTLVLMSV